MIDGTAYDISGGKTLVNGTAYSVKNGKVLIGGTAYDISFLLPPGALNFWSSSRTPESINCITYTNGYWVVGGTHRNGTYYNGYIAYATSLDGNWTTVTVLGDYSSTTEINCITYANGYWVVGGRYQYYNATISYATSLDGPWTTKTVWSGSSYGSYVNAIAYADGYWVVGGCEYDNTNKRYEANIAYATSPGGRWTTKTLWYGDNSSEFCSIECITYANGYWVVGGNRYDANYCGCIAYTTSLSGTWSVRDLWETAYNGNNINCITYADGYWVVGGRYYDGNNRCARIAYATSPSNTWTTKDLSTTTKYNDNYITDITYADGCWAVCGYIYSDSYITRIYYSTSLSGTWTIKTLWSGSEANLNCITNADGYWTVGGMYYDGSNYYARIAYAPTLEGFDEIS